MCVIRGAETAQFTDALDVASASTTANATGASQDFGATDDVVLVIQRVGTVTGTTPTLAGKLQNSADGSTNWLDCPAAGGALATVTASNNIQGATFQRDLRYVRYIGTVGGTTPVFPINIVIVGQKKKV
jgi:hypothetical protein